MYPGEAEIVRRVTIEDLNDPKVSSLLDEVWITNLGNEDFRDASGFHTYFNAFLKEIVVSKGIFWKKCTSGLR